MSNLIGKPTVDWKKTADFTGKWRLAEYDEESFLRFFEAMGYPDTRAALQYYLNAAAHEIIDKGDTTIVKYADPAYENGQRVLEHKVGQWWSGEGPLGTPIRKFVTREGNRLMFEVTAQNGQKHTMIEELQGDKMLFTKRHHGTGITARAVLMREKSKL